MKNIEKILEKNSYTRKVKNEALLDFNRKASLKHTNNGSEIKIYKLSKEELEQYLSKYKQYNKKY